MAGFVRIAGPTDEIGKSTFNAGAFFGVQTIGCGQNLLLFIDALGEWESPDPSPANIHVPRIERVGNADSAALGSIHRVEAQNAGTEEIEAGIAGIGPERLVGRSSSFGNLALAGM